MRINTADAVLDGSFRAYGVQKNAT